MGAKLLNSTPIYLVAKAVRMCTGTEEKMDSTLDKLGPKDKKLISKRILKQDAMSKDEVFETIFELLDTIPTTGGVKERIEELLGEGGFKMQSPMDPAHESTIEHAVYTFEIEFSRTCLQELARHRIASLSVQSTRWALKKLLKGVAKEDLHQFLTMTGDKEIDDANIEQLWRVVGWINAGKSNDKTKFGLPEAFRTRLMFTLNARSLRNWMSLRTANRALWEIREVAFEMASALPEEHKFMFEDRIHEREKENV